MNHGMVVSGVYLCVTNGAFGVTPHYVVVIDSAAGKYLDNPN